MSTTMTAPPDLVRLIEGMTLPALPRTALKLLALSRNEENGPPEYAAVIDTDPALTIQVLRFVNSSYFGFSRQISSVRHGLALVGVRAVKNFVLWNAVIGLVPKPKCGPFDLPGLWSDSLRRAIFARRLASGLSATEREDVFTAALLQDVAIPLLAAEKPKDYSDFLGRRSDGQVRLSSLEETHFGWNHATAAGEIVRAWQMPGEFAELIENHLEVEPLLNAPVGHSSHITVALSALLPSGTDSAWADRDVFFNGLRIFDPSTVKTIDRFCAETDEEYGRFAPTMNLAPPKRSFQDMMRQS